MSTGAVIDKILNNSQTLIQTPTPTPTQIQIQTRIPTLSLSQSQITPVKSKSLVLAQLSETQILQLPS